LEPLAIPHRDTDMGRIKRGNAVMNWIERFAGLSSLDPSVREMLVNRSTVINVPKDTVIFGPGKSPENLLLLLEGAVRVQQLAENGREIVLYRVHAGKAAS